MVEQAIPAALSAGWHPHITQPVRRAANEIDRLIARRDALPGEITEWRNRHAQALDAHDDLDRRYASFDPQVSGGEVAVALARLEGVRANLDARTREHGLLPVRLMHARDALTRLLTKDYSDLLAEQTRFERRMEKKAEAERRALEADERAEEESAHLDAARAASDEARETAREAGYCS